MEEENRGNELIVTVDDITAEADLVFEKYETQNHTGKIIARDKSDRYVIWHMQNGKLHRTSGPARIFGFRHSKECDYFYEGKEYGTEIRDDTGTKILVCDNLVFLDKYIILKEYEKDGIKFYDLLGEDKISFSVPNIKGLIQNSKEEYKQKNTIYHMGAEKFYSSFDEFETEFWNKLMDGTLDPKNELFQIIENL